MFTGIVAARGTVTRLERLDGAARLHVEADDILADLPHGGSLAVDGVCLTATNEPGACADDHRPRVFVADVIGETLRRTTLGELRPGSQVNLERCTRADGRLDGHVVQGHVDAVGAIVSRTDHGTWEILRISVPSSVAPMLAEKGAVAVDGVSLTVTAVSPPPVLPGESDEHWFEVGLIPATLEATGLGGKGEGDRVNLETDVMAKYAARLSAFRSEPAPWSSASAQDPRPSSDDAIRLDSVDAAVGQIRAGGAVVVVDDEDRENEGDIVFAAAHATPELVGFTIRWSSGVLCAPLTGGRADDLGLPPMTAVNEDAKGTAYTVTCDARRGITTGISAEDRATTVRLLASPGTVAADLTRPGHVLPLRGVDGGVLERPGHTEASLELCRMAGLPEAAVIAEVVHDDGSLQRLPALRAFATRHRLPLISIADLAEAVRTSRAAGGADPVGERR